MRNINKYIIVTIFSFFIVSITSCKKQLEVDQSTLYLEDEAVSNPQQLQQFLNSCYDATANQFNGNYQMFSDLMSDDIEKPFNDAGTFRTEAWNRSTTIFNSDVGILFRELYRPIYRINAMDRYYENIPGLSASELNRMKAEGRFLRALCHFKILTLWAQPAGYTTDNSHLGIPIRTKVSIDPIARATVAENYAQIISDLDFAIANLPLTNGNYADIDAAKSLKALVLFQKNDLAGSLILIDEIISSNRFTFSDSLDRYYTNNCSPTSRNSEFIFAFSSTSLADNRGSTFINNYRSDLGAPSLGIRKEIYDIINSDSTDARIAFVKAINAGQANEFFVTTKFNNNYFGTPAITVTQLLLTRSEILARLNQNLPQAVSDVNMIIARAYPTNANKLLASNESAANILITVESERRKELFCEGDRVQYMRRKGAFYDPSTTIRGALWSCDGLTFQFPSTEGSAVFVFNPTGNCN